MNFGELDWQFVFSLVAATGVLVAAIYHIMSLRYNMRARAMEICRLHTSDFLSEQGAQRYTHVMSMEWKDYDDFISKYLASNPDIFAKWMSHFLMFEATGILIKNKVVKPELIYDLAGYAAVETWEKFKDVIQRMRKDPTPFPKIWAPPDFFSNTEFFIQELQKIFDARSS